MPFKHSWATHEKKGAGQKYAKYDTQLVIIVAQPQTKEDGSIPPPSAIYLSKLAMDLLGNPSHIEIVSDGELVGFRATLPEDKAGYVVNRPTEQDEHGESTAKGRPFLSVRSVVKKHRLKPGAYSASKDVSGADVVIYFNARSEPSKVD